jgi:RHS repeat-associated protein
LPKAVTTTFGHDGFGNVTSTNTTASGVAPRITNMTFDNKGRFVVSKEMAAGTAIAQTESFIYDGKWGNPLSSTTTDCITSTFEYDAFGRQKKATGPVFTNNFSMAWDVSGNRLYYCLSDFTGGKPDTKVWYDMLDREVTKQVAGFNNQWLTTNNTYDVRGNETTITNAYYSNETPITTTRLYDAYNRPQTISNGLSSVQYTYSLSGGNLVVTTTDQAGHVSSKTTDAAGRVIAGNDKGGDLYFSYDARGLQTETKHGSTVVLTSTYDDYGRKTNQVDKNAGTITYVYDAFSQLITETDNGNNTHQLAYDELGRMISRQGPEGTTTYEYYKDNSTGCSNNNLKKTTGFNGVIKEYGYDNLMRIATETSTIDNVPYVTTYGYDAYSNVNKITYPSGVEVNRVYDNNGNLMQVTGGSPGAQTTLFNATAKNGAGMYTAYTLANNRTSQLTFENGFPKHFYTQNIQDMNFTWDYANKNLMSRQDYLKGVTENFQYDALNRLTQMAVNGQTPIDITYDGSPTSSMGNIATKTDAGNYTYKNDKIHAVAYITNSTAISNSTVGQVITYTPFLKTETISENDYQIAFTYGPDYQRVKSVLQYQNAVTETRIFVGEYEKFTDNTGTKEIHYIQGGNGLCAIIVKENGSNNIYVPYTDYLGSILTVTDLNGNIVAEQNFDAWGRKRNPQDWTYNNIPTVQTWLYRGFTGHEHLPQFALINMNGRLYDPIQGRMISPDVYVADPYSTQGYNRYSYGNNNPLSYVDPDGNFILFAIGNLISHAIRGDVRDIGDAFHYLGQGAVAGLFTGGLDMLPLVNPLTWMSVVGGLADGIFTGDWTKLDNAGRIFLGNYYLDENRSFWAGVWQGVSRHTWEIIQTTIGYGYSQTRNAVGNVDRVTFFGGATWAWRFNISVNDDETGVTMGSFINMSIHDQNTVITSDPLYMHEYGHTIQSQYWGMLYPFRVMIPSPISAATARDIPGWPRLNTHDTRWYEMQANRYSSRYFGRYFNINWDQYEPRNGGTYPTRNP